MPVLFPVQELKLFSFLWNKTVKIQKLLYAWQTFLFLISGLGVNIFTPSPRRWNRQRVPKRRQNSNGRRGYTQKNAYNGLWSLSLCNFYHSPTAWFFRINSVLVTFFSNVTSSNSQHRDTAHYDLLEMNSEWTQMSVTGRGSLPPN